MIFVLLAAVLQACNVTSGRISACPGTSYTGKAVIKIKGRFRRCKISNGQPYECEGWYSGAAPAIGKDGRWHQCRISTGRIQLCELTGYDGTVVTSP